MNAITDLSLFRGTSRPIMPVGTHAFAMSAMLGMQLVPLLDGPLAQALRALRAGDTLVVVSLDRLARSLSHLLDVIENLHGRGAFFRLLRDPVDTSMPQSLFTLQVLGAAAQLERSLIRERTRSGLRAAIARGKKPGNPRLRAGDLEARRQVSDACRRQYLEDLESSARSWLPTVRQLRAQGAHWGRIVLALNVRRPIGTPTWTEAKLLRALHRLAQEGMVKGEMLATVPWLSSDDRLVKIVAALASTEPRPTLRQIGERLRGLGERTPRGEIEWKPGSIAHPLDRAKRAGLLDPTRP